MERNLINHIIADLPSKIVLLSGPRQCGKTTLAKQLRPNFDYLNFDEENDRLKLRKKSWDRKKKLIIFDEIHKMKSWKRWLKGIYDTEGIPPEIIVTGSARLDVHRRVGDSLAGRYFHYRLHPLDLKEAVKNTTENESACFERLWQCSGFPEPYLKGDERFYKRWRRSHLDIILRQDLLTQYAAKDISSIETLVLMLKERVGSRISYSNLARDLECDAKTIKRWLLLLENLYVIFKVTPHHKKIARSVLKEPKYYFYDYVHVSDPGARLENIVACSLQKELHYLEDVNGSDTSLHYLRTKDGKEIDFLVLVDKTPTHMIEVKTSDTSPSNSFIHFSKFLPKSCALLQLVKNIDRETTYPNAINVRSLITWLANINLIIDAN